MMLYVPELLDGNRIRRVNPVVVTLSAEMVASGASFLSVRNTRGAAENVVPNNTDSVCTVPPIPITACPLT